jgi:hypothetical protein
MTKVVIDMTVSDGPLATHLRYRVRRDQQAS